MGSARSMTGGDLSLVKYMQDKQDISDNHFVTQFQHPQGYTILYFSSLADIPFESEVTKTERGGGGIRLNNNGPEMCRMTFPKWPV